MLLFICFFLGYNGVCVGGAYVEAQVSALLLSPALLPLFFSFLFSAVCSPLVVICSFFTLHVFICSAGDGYSLEHLVVRCCKERMLRHRFKQQQVYISIDVLDQKKKRYTP